MLDALVLPNLLPPTDKTKRKKRWEYPEENIEIPIEARYSENVSSKCKDSTR
jgi:hypothetical protein